MDTEADFMPDESEQLDQLQADETLVDRGVADVLDEGYTTPEHWSVAEGFGNTPAEMHQGESLDQKLAAEVPDVTDTGDDTSWRDDPEEDREVGNRRAGRLVDANHGYDSEDEESDTIGEDVGIDGGAACAEEAAMHIIDPSEDDDFD
ncbi:MAG: DUF5709 domain-containing protein [Propionibacteriaceae bacterium]